MVEVAVLEEVPLREVWANEARDFTPWLAANPDQLGKVLQMDLELEGSEVAVGPFWADVVLRTTDDQLMVVENLLEATDHDHLGKLITYAAGLDAGWAVLVAKSFRPEHRSALNWLNSITDENSGFFGIEVRAVRIGNSAPAVQLDVVVEPDNFSRQARSLKKAESETVALYREWWGAFLPVFHTAHPGWSNASTPSGGNWMNFPTGRSRFSYSLSFSYPAGATNYSMRASLYINDGDIHFPHLLEQKESIEAAFGGTLQWEAKENARSAQIGISLDPADPFERDDWPRYRYWALENLGKLRDALNDPIKGLP